MLKIFSNTLIEILSGSKIDIGSINDFCYMTNSGQLLRNSDITVENETNKIVIIENVLLQQAPTETDLEGESS